MQTSLNVIDNKQCFQRHIVTFFEMSTIEVDLKIEGKYEDEID